MIAFPEENCPACIADAGKAVIMDVKVTEQGFVWHCPVCGSVFTEQELDQIYQTKDKKEPKNRGKNGKQ